MGTTHMTMNTKTELLQQQGLAYLAKGDHEQIIGIDEVGYGAWCGPCVVCAAVVEHGWTDSRVKDSKLVAPADRRYLVKHVLCPPVVLFSVVLEHSNEVIDRVGVAKARDDLVVRAATQCLANYPDAVVVMDGNQKPVGLPAVVLCMPKADNLVPAVSAASIIAKVYRDNLMVELAKQYPGYGMEVHCGYGTARHQEALERLGVSPIHRRSYQNIKRLLQK